MFLHTCQSFRKAFNKHIHTYIYYAALFSGYILTAGDIRAERRWSQSSCSSVKSYMEKEYPHNSQPLHTKPHQRRYSKYYDPDDTSPTSAELTLPWRRDQQNLAQLLTNQMNNGNNAQNTRFRNVLSHDHLLLLLLPFPP